MAASLSACAGGSAPSAAVETYCAGWRPIYPHADDVLTDETAAQILAHDEHGAEQGCWKEPD